MKALNQPESWWGWHGYNQPQALSITQIMRASTFPPRIGAILWLAMEHGRSIILAADPPGAGKTTILTALLAFAKPEASVYFTQGWGETFRLPPIAPGDPPIFLLINEMSDHLPVYSWGPYVQETFALAGKGYAFASTMHADTVDGVIEQLTQECDVPVAHLGRVAFIVPMFVGNHNGALMRRVSEVAVLEPLGQSYDRHAIARWNRDTNTYDILSTPAQMNAAARRLGMEEDDFLEALGKRQLFLEQLLADNILSMDEVQMRALRFMGYDVVADDPADDDDTD